ncbi:Gamma-glutamylcyclotransferase, AIG2-like domain [Dillenia turbinata]|uniref:Gamma-glutamylcyclotransferase family protein n=1 Tax=Dillenia turbinata TaxID=194707 RepID=A0AAN8ZFV9_9MAGN
MGMEEIQQSLVFTYGTLKKGFSNHTLIQDMISSNDAKFVGIYRTVDKFPLVCGPYRVPFLLNMPGSGDRVFGELYAVSPRGLERMDELEGTSKGHYRREQVKVREAGGGGDETGITAEVYFAGESYSEGLWRRCGERGVSSYTEKEAKGYVRRKDRPQNLTFLEQIRLFVNSDSD